MVMPYHLDKGPTMTFLESFLNGDLVTVVDGLDALRRGTDLLSIGGLDPGDPTLEERLRENWFGQQRSGGGTWQPQAPFSSDDPSPTGYWIGYHGDVEAILREALIRAGEVALGLDHGERVPWSDGSPNPPRRWPIEVFWTCPNPWFEAWVTWRDRGGGDGHVMLLLKSPADSFNRTISDLTRPRHAYTGMIDPVDCSAPSGMWVISHPRHHPQVVERDFRVPIGSEFHDMLGAAREALVERFGSTAAAPTFRFPQLATMRIGERERDGTTPVIVTVSPPYADGGVEHSVGPST